MAKILGMKVWLTNHFHFRRRREDRSPQTGRRERDPQDLPAAIATQEHSCCYSVKCFGGRWEDKADNPIIYNYTHVLMRNEKEERKKQARSNKQQGKATQHTCTGQSTLSCVPPLYIPVPGRTRSTCCCRSLR